MSLNFTSIYGRWLGVTYGSSAGQKGGQNKYLSGDVQGVKMANLWFGDQSAEIAQFGRGDATQTLSSASTGTQISAGGVTLFTSGAGSSSLTWTLAPPFPSARKTVAASSVSSGTITVRLSTVLGGNFQSTAGSSFQALTLNSPGEAAELVGLSTSLWQVITNTSSAAMTT